MNINAILVTYNGKKFLAKGLDNMVKARTERDYGLNMEDNARLAAMNGCPQGYVLTDDIIHVAGAWAFPYTHKEANNA